MKCVKFIFLVIIFLSFITHSIACSDIFINKGGYHIEGRTMDFSTNMAFTSMFGFIDQNNTTDIVIDVDKIPNSQLTSWVNKYGYYGRSAFNGPKIVDGMNTEGFSIAVLTLPGSKYPSYNANDKRPVLAIYDLPTYLLSQASTISEGIQLIHSHQLVQSAIEEKDGCFIKDIDIHFVMRDKTGSSAVVEFINGQVKIYENSGNILTNAPTFEWQLQNASYYNSLLVKNKKIYQDIKKNIYEYNKIFKSSPAAESNLLGMLGDFTSASRFARAAIILNNFPDPHSTQEALYQAESLLNLVMVPKLDGAASATIWSIIKDLDNQVFYIKDSGYFNKDGTLSPLPITRGYTIVDLKNINFKIIPLKYRDMTIKPTKINAVKKIISANNIPLFSGNE